MILDKMYQTIIDDITEKVWDKILHKLDETNTKKNINTKELTIDDLNLSVRISNCFKDEDINSIPELCEYTASQLLSLPNIGRISLREIENAMAQFGLKLK